MLPGNIPAAKCVSDLRQFGGSARLLNADSRNKGNGVQTTVRIQRWVGLRQFLRSDAIDKLHHAKLFGLVKFKSQHLH